MTCNKKNINVEIIQIQITLKLFELIKFNIEEANCVIIYGSNINNVPESIINLYKNKTQLKIKNRENLKNIIENKIKDLCLKNLLEYKDEENNIKIHTIFGKTTNERLIAIDKWLDKWIFCCM